MQLTIFDRPSISVDNPELHSSNDPALEDLKEQFNQLLQKYNKGKGKLYQDDHLASLYCSSLVLNSFQVNDWIVDTGGHN